MTESQSDADALVLFGATGDLAFKKTFLALQAMIKRGHLTVPVIGVAKANRHVAELRDRVRESLTQFGGGVDEAAFANSSSYSGLSMATTGRTRSSFASARNSGGPDALSITWRSRPVCFARWSRASANRAVLMARGWWSKSHSGGIWYRLKH